MTSKPPSRPPAPPHTASVAAWTCAVLLGLAARAGAGAAPSGSVSAVEALPAETGAAGQAGEPSGPAAKPSGAGEIPDEVPEAELRARAIAALRAGDDATAHRLVEQLLVGGRVRRAREALAAERLDAALALLDEALAVAPHHVDALVLRGETRLGVGERGGSAATLLAGRADLEAARAEGSLRGHFGAARAARLLGAPEEALELVHAGLDVLRALPSAEAERLRADLARAPEREWAAAACAALDALDPSFHPDAPAVAAAPGPQPGDAASRTSEGPSGPAGTAPGGSSADPASPSGSAATPASAGTGDGAKLEDHAAGRPAEASAVASEQVPAAGEPAAAGSGAAAAAVPAVPTVAAEATPPAVPDPERRAALVAETRAALAALLGRRPESVWAWLRLARLETATGAPEAARRACLAGLALAPEAEELHAELGRAARAAGGSEAVLAARTELAERFPSSPAALWHAGVERFRAALDALDAGSDPRASFLELEERFRRCRALAPERARACLGYELLCRAGVGWCRLGTGDLAGAREAFQSMEDLAERGMRWSWPGRLPAGVRGLEAVAREYARASDDADSLGRAAAIYDFLRVYAPERADHAESAGFLNRDTAVVLEQEARRAARLAADASATPEDRARAAQVAERRYAEAWEIMERALAAYRDATRLAPDDVRTLTDAGHVLTHYLWRDVETAERWLRRAIELGSARLADPALDGDRRYELENAVGDAHRNLGLLYLTQKRDPARAREYLLESVAIGPDPRPRVTGELLPDCDRLAAGDAAVVEKHRWGRRPR